MSDVEALVVSPILVGAQVVMAFIMDPELIEGQKPQHRQRRGNGRQRTYDTSNSCLPSFMK
jgi:hypothetical protein